MARLRFVGRSGRKLKEKRQLSKNIKNIPPKNAKLKLLKNVHNGINEFCKIADGDSDEDNDFEGFKKEDVKQVVKSNFLAVELSRSAKKVNVENTQEVKTWLRSSANKVSIESFKGIVCKSFKKQDIPKTPKSSPPQPSPVPVSQPVEQKTPKKNTPKVEKSPEPSVSTSKIFPLCKNNTTNNKCMKGSIKIRFSRPSFYKDLGARKFSKSAKVADEEEEEEDEDESELMIDEGEKKDASPKKKNKKSSKKRQSGGSNMTLLNKELGPVEGRDEEKVVGVGGWIADEYEKMKVLYQVFKSCQTLASFQEANKTWTGSTVPEEEFIEENHVEPMIPTTPVFSPRKLPSLEAPLICTSKRTPKPNHRFLDNVWEEDFENHTKSRKKSVEKVEMVKKKVKCCVCSVVRDVQRRMKEIGSSCCGECANFYLDKAPLFVKGKLNIACMLEPNSCTADKNPCDSCKFKKCLMLLPSPSQIVSNIKKGLLDPATLTTTEATMGEDMTILEEALQQFMASTVTSEQQSVIVSQLFPAYDLNYIINKFAPKAPEVNDVGIKSESKKVSKSKSHRRYKKQKSKVSLSPLPQEPPVVPNGTETSPPSQPRGPRIKHVCREASVALGKPLATFSSPLDLRLSALPSVDKVKIFNEATPQELTPSTSSTQPSRRHRQNKNYWDMVMMENEDEEEEMEEEEEEDDDVDYEDDAGAIVDYTDKEYVTKADIPAPSPSFSTSTRFESYKRTVRCHQCDRCLRPDCGKCRNCRDMPKFGGRGLVKQACEHRTCLNPIPPMSWRKKNKSSMSSKIKKPSTKTYKKLKSSPRSELRSSIDAKRTKPPGTRATVKYPSSHPPTPRSIRDHSINNFSDIKLPDAPVSLDYAWKDGVSLVTSGCAGVRQVCRLCGTLGHQSLIHCHVCAEPFHEGCMDDRPRPDEVWCCLRCQFCRVCLRQGDLLQCHTCHQSFHPSCLVGPHPTEATKNSNIWVCASCVKCKSCGTNTPGRFGNATWKMDFTLCGDCSDLRRKGNYCPVCDKCYQEDDWDSQMMQCSHCSNWVHAKCEELSDEMYQMLVHMGDDVPFECRVCKPSNTAWKRMLQNELNDGLRNILNAFIQTDEFNELRSIGKSLVEKEKNKLSSASFTSISTTSVISNNNNSNTVNINKNSSLHNGFDNIKVIKCNSDASNITLSNVTNVNDIVALSKSTSYLNINNLNINNNISNNLNTTNNSEKDNSNNNSMETYNNTEDIDDDVDDDFSNELINVFANIHERLNNSHYKSISSLTSEVLTTLDNIIDTLHCDLSSVSEALYASLTQQVQSVFSWCKTVSSVAEEVENVANKDTSKETVFYAPPSDEHTYALWKTKKAEEDLDIPSSFYKSGVVKKKEGKKGSKVDEGHDPRICVLCWISGDSSEQECGRLLYMGQNEWIHLNCALWSAEVYEQTDGVIQKTFSAVARGRKLRCDGCGKHGATVGCCHNECHANFHFMCARNRDCCFLVNKKVFCNQHAAYADARVLDDYEVTHRVIMEADKNVKKQWLSGLSFDNINIINGALTIEYMGNLTALSDTKSTLVPVNFRSSRLFWSTQDAHRLTYYHVRVFEAPRKQHSSHKVSKEVDLLSETSTLSASDEEDNISESVSASNSNLQISEKSRVEKRTRGRPPKGSVKVPSLMPRRSKTASLISKLRHQGSEEAEVGKKKSKSRVSTTKTKATEMSGAVTSWQAGQNIRQMFLNKTPFEQQDFVDVEKAEDDDIPLFQIVEKLNSAAAKNNQLRKKMHLDNNYNTFNNTTTNNNNYFDSLEENDWVNNVYPSAKKPQTIKPINKAPQQNTSRIVLSASDIESILAIHKQQQQLQQQQQTLQQPRSVPQQIRIINTNNILNNNIMNTNNNIINTNKSILNTNFNNTPKLIVRQAIPPPTTTTPTENFLMNNTKSAPKYKLVLTRNPKLSQLDGQNDDDDDELNLSEESDDDDLQTNTTASSVATTTVPSAATNFATSSLTSTTTISDHSTITTSFQDQTSCNKRKFQDDEEEEDEEKQIKKMRTDDISGKRSPLVQNSNNVPQTDLAFNQSPASINIVTANTIVSTSTNIINTTIITNANNNFCTSTSVSLNTAISNTTTAQVVTTVNTKTTTSNVTFYTALDNTPTKTGIKTYHPRNYIPPTQPTIHSLQSSSCASFISSVEDDEDDEDDDVTQQDKPPQQPPSSPQPRSTASTADDDEEEDEVNIEEMPLKMRHGDDDDSQTSARSPRAPTSQGDEDKENKHAPKQEMRLLFEVTSDDGFKVVSSSINKAWKMVVERVKEVRSRAGIKSVPFTGLTGAQLSGLDLWSYLFLLEQMPECQRLKNYQFKIHKDRWKDREEVLIGSKWGFARGEPFKKLDGKHDMFSFLLSKFRCKPNFKQNKIDDNSKNNLELPMAMRFRQLKNSSKEVVGVYRSPIHGRGLFCKVDVAAGEMIIEYSGEVIRACLTDKREKNYESRGIGCYMFRKDMDHVIDSTLMGNASRFINHSCEPNCYSRVIQVDSRKHIVIFAQRDIKRGEELTYDYKFPIEDVKILCLCGSRKCRKYLN